MVTWASRFTEAMKNFPSQRTEDQLVQIIEDIHDQPYAKTLKFQCEREISKSKIEREEYQEAIPFLLQSLKTDEYRTDVWMQLALCAQKTLNIRLFVAAETRLRSLRPQQDFGIEEPPLPVLVVPSEGPSFVGYSIPIACWKWFVIMLQKGLQESPYSVPQIVIMNPPVRTWGEEKNTIWNR